MPTTSNQRATPKGYRQRTCNRPSLSTDHGHHRPQNGTPGYNSSAPVDDLVNQRASTTSVYFTPRAHTKALADMANLTQPFTNSVPPAPILHEAVGLLPWCTTHMRLSDVQAAALTDVGGSLRDIMLVAMKAAVDPAARDEIERAVGREAANGVIEFFSEEYAMD